MASSLTKGKLTRDYLCCSCNTRLLQTSCSYTWKIDDFEDCDLLSARMHSPMFSSNFGTNIYNWHLRLNPDHEGFVKLFLYVDNCPDQGLQVEMSYSIIGDKGTSVYDIRDNETNPFNHHCRNYTKFIARETLLADKEKYLPDGMLTIQCDLKVMTVLLHESQVFPIEFPRCELAKDMSKLLLAGDPMFSDVVLCSNGTEFKAHKNILSARSPVFEAMFKAPMKESNEKKVDIGDIKPEVLKDLLGFIYTGTVSEIGKNAKELLSAADMYLLGTLKQMCEQHLLNDLTVENVCSLLVTADRHSADSLKKAAIDFIVKNAKSVRKTKEWTAEVYKFPQLMDEVISSLHGIAFADT